MLGDGIVSFGVTPGAGDARRNSKSSAKIVLLEVHPLADVDRGRL